MRFGNNQSEADKNVEKSNIQEHGADWLKTGLIIEQNGLQPEHVIAALSGLNFLF